MKLKEAMETVTEFPEWVDDSMKRLAKKVAPDIRWFIQRLYAKGYEIIKKEMRE